VRATASVVACAWIALLATVLAIGFLLRGPLEASIGTADDRFMSWLAQHRSADLTTLGDIGTLPGETLVEAAGAPLIVLGVWLWARSVRAVAYMAIVVAGEAGIYLIAANTVRRQRPSVPQLDPGLVSYHSYPSGHVAAAMAMYVGLAVLVWPASGRVGRVCCVMLCAIPLAVSAARLYEGAHHPSDVLVSLLYVGVWIVAVRAIVLGPGRSASAEPRPREHSSRDVLGRADGAHDTRASR
jgi:undecaprenyl-diphosphatase